MVFWKAAKVSGPIWFSETKDPEPQGWPGRKAMPGSTTAVFVQLWNVSKDGAARELMFPSARSERDVVEGRGILNKSSGTTELMSKVVFSGRLSQVGKTFPTGA